VFTVDSCASNPTKTSCDLTLPAAQPSAPQIEASVSVPKTAPAGETIKFTATVSVPDGSGSPLTATVNLDPTRGLKDEREMTSSLVTTEAGSAAAGFEGITEGATGNPRQGQANPIPLPANPLPESLQYVTVYSNKTEGGFAGSEPYPKGALLRATRLRAEERYQASFAGHATLYIADSPRDVDAAKIGEALSVGVASGRASAAELRDAGADAVLQDLTDPIPLIDLITARP